MTGIFTDGYYCGNSWGGTDTKIRGSTESWPWRRKFSRCSCRDSNLRPFDHWLITVRRRAGPTTTQCHVVSYPAGLSHSPADKPRQDFVWPCQWCLSSAAESENNFLYHLFWFLYYHNDEFKMHNNFKQTKSKRTGQSPLTPLFVDSAQALWASFCFRIQCL